MKIGDRVFVQGYVDEIRKDCVIVRNRGGYFGTEKCEVIQGDLVRCKDCKHYEFADNRAFGTPVKYCDWFGFEDVDDDDFCSRGERREDGEA